MSRTRAFTLMELLTVVAVIGLLTGILLPIYARSQRKAREVACLSNIRQIGTALLMYAQDWGGCAPPYSTSRQDRIVLHEDEEKPTVIEVTPFNDPHALKQCFAPYGAGGDELWACPLDAHDDPTWIDPRDPTRTYHVSPVLATRRPVRLDAPPTVSVETFDRQLRDDEQPYKFAWVQSDDLHFPVPHYLVCCVVHESSNNRPETTRPHGRRYPMLKLDGSVVWKPADPAVFPSGATAVGD